MNSWKLMFALLAGVLLTIPASALPFVDAPGTFPHGLTTDGTNLWCADYDGARVYKLDANGQTVGSFALSFSQPRGLAYTNGVLFVASGSRIYRLDANNGTHLSDFGSPDATSPNHQGLAYGDGKLWIASRGADDRIFGVDPLTGASLVDFAAPGSNPRGLTFHEGALWNLDSSDDRIHRLSTVDGSVQASHPIPLGNPRGCTFWNGSFIQSDPNVDTLMRFTITNTWATVALAPSRFFKPGRPFWIPYMSSHPVGETNEAIRRILFFQHGISDNAPEYFARARYAARLEGHRDDTLVVAFQLIDDNKLIAAPPADMLYWTGGRFWGGLSAGASAPYPRPERYSAFELLDDFLTQLTGDTRRFPRLEEIVISGHSGGGQFANRYAATSPFENTLLAGGGSLSMHYVVMNPSSYVYFNALRYDPATLDLDAGVVDFVTPNPAVPGHNEYGYGLDDLYSYPAAVGSGGIQAQYSGRKVIYLVGDADTGSGSLDVDPEAMLQGSNRYERALIYYEHLKDHFGHAGLSRHRLAEIPGV
ncbi:MAG: hypothetical protein AAF492_12950, partial [Verrucomicrobiota bacterium]